jgi:cell division protein FtsZ
MKKITKTIKKKKPVKRTKLAKKPVKPIVKKRAIKKPVVKKRAIKKPVVKKHLRKKRVQQEATNIKQTKIKLIGIGGGGCSIVSEISSSLKRIDFIGANTDVQALKKMNKNCKKLQFGQELTNGLGCGMNPELGKKSAESEKEKIKKMLEDTDFCILVSCLGGGAGSGASPIFADICKELKIISFGIFTLPFKFEGEKKYKIAQNALEKIKPNLNGYTIIPNERIFQIIDRSTPLEKSLYELNKILEQGLEGLIEMIYLPGLINIDWSDLRAILSGQGKLCFLNSGQGKRDQTPEELTREALNNKLNTYNIEGAEKILYNIASDKDITMEEVQRISENITSFNPKAKIIFGVSFHPKYKGKIKITLLAVGCEEQGKLKEKAKQIKEKIVSLQLIKNIPDENQKDNKELESPTPARDASRSDAGGSDTGPVSKEPVSDATPAQQPDDNSITGVPAGDVEHRDTNEPAQNVIAVSKQKPQQKQTKKKPKKSAKKPKPQKPKKAQNHEKKISSPLLLPQDALKRKNALELKKEAEEAEKKLLEQEEQWETPAFLRKD